MQAEIPEGWSTYQLKEAASSRRDSFVDGPFGSNLKTTDYSESGVQLIQLQNIGEGFFVGDNRKFVPQEKADELARHKAVPGDVVIAKMAEPVARACRVPEDSAEWVIVADCMRLRVDEDRFDPDFLVSAINAPTVRSEAEARATGSTRKRINLGKTKTLPFIAPPLPEQKRIAAVLASVDEAIRTTEAVIEQTRRVKEGLLQDLLTRGIGHSRFKQTEIGEIPEAWEVSRVQSLLADVDPAMRSGPFGSALLKSELVESGIPLLGIDNVHVESFKAAYKRFVTEEKFLQLERYAVRPADVMITIMGTVGRACLVPDGIGRALSSKHTWTLTLDREVYLPYLACAQFNYAPWVLRHFQADQQGGTMDAIRSETLRSARLPVPPLDEQIRIAEILQAADENARAHEDQLASLTETKAGLLQVLLTGAVRVSA